jgi:electron transfer flavoprotein alpha/beta subunit
MLKIVVCVKAVPDPKQACKLKIDPLTKTLLRCDVPTVLNPLDKHALEAALQVKAVTEAHISVLSMGPPDASSIVKECMALGADKGILLCDPCFGGADAYATSYTLAMGVQKIGDVDAVLCGMASSDGATEWVGPEMAIMLDMPVVTRVREISLCDEESWEVKAAQENGYRRMRVRLPVLLTVTRDLNAPRALSFSGIIKARKKVITQWDLHDLGVSAEAVGVKGSPTIVTEMCAVDNARRVTFLEGAREEKAEQLLQKLIEGGVL